MLKTIKDVFDVSGKIEFFDKEDDSLIVLSSYIEDEAKIYFRVKAKKESKKEKKTVLEPQQKQNSPFGLYIVKDGIIFRIQCSPSDTINEIKQKIQVVKEIPPEQQRLIYAGVELQDDRMVDDYSIPNNGRIHLILRLRGGKPVILFYPPKNQSMQIKSCKLGLDKDKWALHTLFPKKNMISKDNSAVEWKDFQVKPDGKIQFNGKNEKRNYPYLFWEADSILGGDFKFSKEKEVYLLKKKEVLEVLEQMLELKGLNDTEITNFVTYWQSQLESKDFCLVQFMDQQKYEKIANLSVSPVPEEIFRVFLKFLPISQSETKDIAKFGLKIKNGKDWKEAKNSIKKIEIDETKFSVFEWGGMNIKNI